MTTFVKAERKQGKLRIGISGPSGSGKTFSALLIASGMGKRIAVADSENRSASLYAGMDKGPLVGIEFDIVELEPPYTVDKFTAAIVAAEAGKYDVLILDSISHEWAGEGGLLSKKEALDQRGGNSYTNWAGITKEHEVFKAKILNAGVHIICTMRSKQDYVLEMNEKGKQAPKKVGLAPIQREGMEYEFTTVFDLAMDHNAVASKDRTSIFDGQVFKPTVETGKTFMKWLMGGKPVPKPAPAPAAKPEPEPVAVAETGKDSGRQADDDYGAITQATLNQITAAIAGLKKLGPKEMTVWAGIQGEIQRVHHREFAEPSELSKAEGATVLSYLAQWRGHVEAKANAGGNGKGA